MTSKPNTQANHQQKGVCITQEDIDKLVAGGRQIVIIDVRDPQEYAEQHIPQARNIPLSTLDQSMSTLIKGTMIITACGKGGGRSAEAATQLQSHGFVDTKWLCGGTFGWS